MGNNGYITNRDFKQDALDLADRLEKLADWHENKAFDIFHDEFIFVNDYLAWLRDNRYHQGKADAYRIATSCIRRTMQTGKGLLAGIDHIPR